MTDPKEAIPVAFHVEQDLPGRVYRGHRQGPPLRVTECNDWERGDCLVVEYEDLLKRACLELFEKDIDPVVSLCFSVSDARYLTVGLINALAEAGDVVAISLKEALVAHLEKHEDSD